MITIYLIHFYIFKGTNTAKDFANRRDRGLVSYRKASLHRKVENHSEACNRESEELDLLKNVQRP